MASERGAVEEDEDDFPLSSEDSSYHSKTTNESCRVFIRSRPLHDNMKSRLSRAFNRAKHAAIFAAIGAAIGGLFGRSHASSGAAAGALIGATIGEKRAGVDSMSKKVKEDVRKAVPSKKK